MRASVARMIWAAGIDMGLHITVNLSETKYQCWMNTLKHFITYTTDLFTVSQSFYKLLKTV